jgi:hypothetical protein
MRCLRSAICIETSWGEINGGAQPHTSKGSCPVICYTVDDVPVLGVIAWFQDRNDCN